jgi:hypothetical protein
MMLVNAEGIRFLTEDRLLPQILECFSELDHVSLNLDRAAAMLILR